MKIAWTLLCRGRTDEFIYSVRTHAPFVDKSIIILHGSDEENAENIDFLKNECTKWNIDVVRTNIPYDPKPLRDLYMEKLDEYTSEVGEQVWFLITDSDEYLELPALYSLRKIAEKAEAEGINIVGFNSHDIQTTPNGDVWENKSGYWNPNFNKHYPGMRYTPGTHIGIARPAPANMANAPLRYFHVKTTGSQWIRGCRNAWSTCEVAQNSTNDSNWQYLKSLWEKHGFEEFGDFFRYMCVGNIHQDFKQWFILHRNHKNSEFRSFFVSYFVLMHPEENVGCVGNKDFPYNKDLKPVPLETLTF